MLPWDAGCHGVQFGAKDGGNIDDCEADLVRVADGKAQDTEAEAIKLSLPTLKLELDSVDTDFEPIDTDAQDSPRCPIEQTLGDTYVDAADAADQDDTVVLGGDVSVRSFTERADVEAVKVELVDPSQVVRETRLETVASDPHEHPGQCGDFGNCVEYFTLFEAIVDEKGYWTARVTFLDSEGNPIAEIQKAVYVDSLFVLPESPVGVVALVASSLAILGGFIIVKRRTSGY